MGDALLTVDLGTGRTAVDISLGATHACAVLDDASMKCWGQNVAGALGIGDVSDRGDQPGEMGDALPAVALGTGRTALRAHAGDRQSCAQLDDATAKCWGFNQFGQAGQGDTFNRGTAANQLGDSLASINLGTGRTAIALGSGGILACSLLDNLSVKCWGNNYFGQLGKGDTLNRGDQPGEMGDALLPVLLE